MVVAEMRSWGLPPALILVLLLLVRNEKFCDAPEEISLRDVQNLQLLFWVGCRIEIFLNYSVALEESVNRFGLQGSLCREVCLCVLDLFLKNSIF